MTLTQTLQKVRPSRNYIINTSCEISGLTIKSFVPGRARIIVYATLEGPIGETHSCAMARRESAELDDFEPFRQMRRAGRQESAVLDDSWFPGFLIVSEFAVSELR